MDKGKRDIEKQRELRKLRLTTMAPERSNPLHNFSLPYLKWGSRRFLKCMKIPSNTDPSVLDHQFSLADSKSFEFRDKPFNFVAESITNNIHPPHQNQNSTPKSNTTNNDCVVSDNNIDIETVQEKLAVDQRVTSKKLKVSVLKEGGENESAAARPWNLRTRRAACKSPREEKKTQLGSLPVLVEEKEKEMAKFSISLTKEEVEEDFAAMVGTKPPRRPKKRPKIVQKQLDSIFPGLWLSEVTADSYKVSDVPE